MSDTACFLYFNAFSKTGGIEKYNRAFLKALQAKRNVVAISLYDAEHDGRYAGNATVYNCKGNFFNFLRCVVESSRLCDRFFIGHIHLLYFGLLVKILNPCSDITFNIHGVEVWRKFSVLKRRLLRPFTFLAVSEYTANEFCRLNNLPRCRVLYFPNCIDPFFKLPKRFSRPEYLMRRYNITDETKVLLAVTRMSAQDENKNFIKLIEVLPKLKKRYPSIVLILAGKCDATMLFEIPRLVKRLELDNNVILPGFIAAEELTDHYLLADVYTLPSKKEGFGITFIEALACGLKVVGGDAGGSAALLKNEMCFAADPDDAHNIFLKLQEAINCTVNEEKQKRVQNNIMQLFSFQGFSKNLTLILNGDCSFR